MKKQLAACGLAVAATASHAQSSVTLYGIVDIGLTYTNNAQTGVTGGVPRGGAQFAISDAHTTGLSGSRWGLRGKEELGGGLSAIFVLENGFMTNSGALAQGGAESGRQAYVGLMSTNAGTVTLGRQYDPLVDSVQPFGASGAWGGYMSSHLNDVDNLSNTNRINNSIKFTTPNFHGLRAGALYSFGGVAGNQSQNQIWSVGASYSSDTFAAGIGYLNARNPNISFYGNTPNKGPASANNIGSFGSATTPESSPAIAGYASAHTTEILGAGASYTLGAATVSAVVTSTRFDALGASSGPNPRGYTGHAAFTSAELGVRYRWTPALLTGAAFDYTKRNSVNGDGGAKYLQLDLGAIYSLSKRTDLYALAVLQRATGRDSLGQPAVANVSGFTPSSTDKQIGMRLGIRHKF